MVATGAAKPVRVTGLVAHTHQLLQGLALRHPDTRISVTQTGAATPAPTALRLCTPEGQTVALRAIATRFPKYLRDPNGGKSGQLVQRYYEDQIDDPANTVWRSLAEQFQVLAKRPGRLRRLLESQKFVDTVWTEMERLSEDDAVPLARPVREGMRKRVANWNALSPWPLPNVWIGTSIESDEYCWRADELRALPASVRFLSLEPLLGPVPSLELSRIDWVIVGGESGPDHRPLDLAWVRDIRDRCVDLRVALFFKQVGGLTPKAGGRLLDGRTWDEYPAMPTGVGCETGNLA
jgi:protein gp37